ncbi:MAG: DnaJ C-terminal domain-containing protein [Gammaproteobacteria bacterium]|nr:DnaJ C-terminal domain-containing protein [Gammaproteobacteria bacterium]
MEYRDYYKILGVARDAKLDEVKRAYRKLARKFHPDVSKEPNAEERFKEVQEAYEVLKDPQKRSAYDQLGSNWQSGQEFRPPPGWQGGFGGFGGGDGFAGAGGGEGFDFSDFFASLFGQQRAHAGAQQRRAGRQAPRGRDERARIAISLEDAYRGGSQTINIQSPVRDQYGQIHQQTRTLKITIPPGILPGQQLRLAKQGAPSMGGVAGDLYLEIEMKPHKIFTLDGHNISVNLPITPWEAALGAKVKVPTLAGPVELKIAPGSQSGQKLRLKGRGFPSKPTPGDQFVILQILTPPAKTDADRALYEQMAKAMAFDPRKND